MQGREGGPSIVFEGFVTGSDLSCSRRFQNCYPDLTQNVRLFRRILKES